MMTTLTRESLWSLETYARERADFRQRVLTHKKPRRVPIGKHVTLIYEDELTVRYQIQEMLRIEKTFEEAGIQDELDAYTPLIPAGRDFRATMMIEYPNEQERRAALVQLKGVEREVWMQVDGHEKAFAIADEDMERENDEKTSAVHFLRFPINDAMAEALKDGAALGIGVSHRAYQQSIEPVSEATRLSLSGDLA